jgi:hypothetical protein
MMNYGKRLLAASLTLAATSLATMAWTSAASAQCAPCSEYSNRDPFTGGLARPANPGRAIAPGAASISRSTRNAHAEMRGHRTHHLENRHGRAR